MNILKFIDDFLNNITMYRLTLYCVIFLWLVGLIFSILGILPLNPINLLASLAVTFVVCVLVNELFAKIFKAPLNFFPRRPVVFKKSAVIIICSFVLATDLSADAIVPILNTITVSVLGLFRKPRSFGSRMIRSRSAGRILLPARDFCPLTPRPE